MKKLQQRTNPKFKLLSRKGAFKIKGGCGNSGEPCPPPYEPGGSGDKKDGFNGDDNHQYDNNNQ